MQVTESGREYLKSQEFRDHILRLLEEGVQEGASIPECVHGLARFAALCLAAEENVELETRFRELDDFIDDNKVLIDEAVLLALAEKVKAN